MSSCHVQCKSLWILKSGWFLVLIAINSSKFQWLLIYILANREKYNNTIFCHGGLLYTKTSVRVTWRTTQEINWNNYVGIKRVIAICIQGWIQDFHFIRGGGGWKRKKKKHSRSEFEGVGACCAPPPPPPPGSAAGIYRENLVIENRNEIIYIMYTVWPTKKETRFLW